MATALPARKGSEYPDNTLSEEKLEALRRDNEAYRQMAELISVSRKIEPSSPLPDTSNRIDFDTIAIWVATIAIVTLFALLAVYVIGIALGI